MPRLSRFQVLKLIKPKIIKKLELLEKDVLSFMNIIDLMDYCKNELMLPRITSKEEFLEFLVENKILIEYKLVKEGNVTKRYVYRKDTSIYEIALSINKKAYLSHYSAMYINNLTDNVPKHIYINIEQCEKTTKNGVLKQEYIDKAFSSPFRKTNNIYKIEGKLNNVYVLNGKFSDRYGVKTVEFEGRNLEVTSIERTLIDIVVRPQYSGDTLEVLNAYKLAKGRVSINRLRAILKKLDYTYPYHQAIGLYMEKAGYDEKQLNLLKNIHMEYDFYLTNEMNEISYSKEWKIYYPKDL